VIPAKVIDGLPSGFHEQGIDLAGINQAKLIELVRQSEDQMVIGAVDELLLSGLDPSLLLGVLTLSAVAVSARVIAVMVLAAVITNIQMSPQCRRSTAPDGMKDAQLISVAMLFDKRPLPINDAGNGISTGHES